MKSNKQKRIIGYLILIISLICPEYSFGQPIEQTIKSLNDNHISTRELKEHISQIIDSVNIPGLSIAIINDNKVVYHNVFGVTNSLTLEPVNKKSIFEAASLSKPIFAYFVMKMVEEGKLNFNFKPNYLLIYNALIYMF